MRRRMDRRSDRWRFGRGSRGIPRGLRCWIPIGGSRSRCRGRVSGRIRGRIRGRICGRIRGRIRGRILRGHDHGCGGDRRAGRGAAAAAAADAGDLLHHLVEKLLGLVLDSRLGPDVLVVPRRRLLALEFLLLVVVTAAAGGGGEQRDLREKPPGDPLPAHPAGSQILGAGSMRGGRQNHRDHHHHREGGATRRMMPLRAAAGLSLLFRLHCR
mmetsp:Transcript_588/g.1283  ORF Transcript_588/g.1283 Transcript_588/m.1283 type:complete len:213 (+) Transcript_588:1621-2259(+)